MSLVFAAIVPHPPILLPTIGKEEEIKRLAKTKQAFEKLEEDLYLSKPEIVIVISPHGTMFPDAFTVNSAPEYRTDLREFGDIATDLHFRGEPGLSYRIRENSKGKNVSITMISEEHLDHGSAVPLFFLSQHLGQFTLLPIGFSDLSTKNHLEFGEIIKEEIMNTNKRVAVIASADLSHALVTNAPAGFNPAGAEFDQKIQDLLTHHNTTGMLQMDEQLAKNAAECGLRSILILLGILRDIDYDYKSYAYEAPFGIGYLTANFIL